MPCKGVTDNFDNFQECLDQIHEIISKYNSSHSIFIGGDFNEDYESGSTRRSSSLKDFLSDHCLAVFTDKTFIHPNGVDSTTVDHFFFSKSFSNKVIQVKWLDIPENNSDHYPVTCTLSLHLDKTKKKADRTITSKINWKKTDLDGYRRNLVELLAEFEVTAASASGLDNSVVKFNNILQKTASLAGPPQV